MSDISFDILINEEETIYQLNVISDSKMTEQDFVAALNYIVDKYVQGVYIPFSGLDESKPV